MSKESATYAALGASSSKAGMLDAISAESVSEFFAEPVADVCGDPLYYSLLHADGVGTKAIAAYLAFRETGDPAWFRSLAQDSLVMNLDDVACVGAFESLALSNTIGRNRFLIPDEVIGEIIHGYREVVERLKEVGIAITLTGGETADIGDLVRTIVIDSTLLARVRRDAALRASRIQSGDIIIGLSNTGQATYECQPNSSLGSNGYTLARHALISNHYAEKYPEIVDPSIEVQQRYRGRHLLFDVPAGMQHNVAQALLSPTRTYAPILKQVLQRCGLDIHAAIHCSGGGQTKLLRFGNNKHYVKDNLFPIPPVFNEIQQACQVPWAEMYAVFNMGHRMELIGPKKVLSTVIDIAASFGIEAKQVGHVSDGTGANTLSLNSAVGKFDYR